METRSSTEGHKLVWLSELENVEYYGGEGPQFQ